MKKFFLLLILIPVFAFTESMYSPTWGFFLDLPEGYEYIDGDGRDRFSFMGPSEAMFDLVIYEGRYRNMSELINDVNRRIGNQGDVDFFQYRDKQAAVIELIFGDNVGWGLCVELYSAGLYADLQPPMLLALAYGPADFRELELLHISALDSICPSIEERYYPGPLIEYGYPRGGMIPVSLEGGINSLIRENDAIAAQILIEREFQILQLYANTPFLQEAWIRYYRFIFRDSCDRITNLVSALVRSWGGYNAFNDEARRTFAQRALTFVQDFEYERNFEGSDFLNLVTALTEGRGDCDSRSMIWALILAHADIRAAMMVSGHYGHAMGLADVHGTGARFESHGVRWLVGETTASVDIGLIAQEQSDPQYWFAVVFD